MKFSEKIKTLRNSAELTQQQLSKHLGITASAIGYLENGQRDPTGSTLVAYAKFFNVTIDYLVGLEPDIEDRFFLPLTKENPAPILNQDGKELIEIFNQLEHGYQVQILEYARFIAERRGIKTNKA